MCKIIDDILPIVGAVIGTVIAPGVGTAIGAGLGGFAGNYAQTHNFGSAALGGLVAGGTSALGGGLGSLMGTGAESAATIAPDAFSTGIDAGAQAGTTGAMESGLGGAATFGPAAGTGTAIQGATTGLAGENLGIAGGGALSGVSGAGGFAGPLGGATTGTGLPGTESNLNGVMTNAQMGPTASATGVTGGAPTAPQANPVSTLSNTGTGSMGISPMDQSGGVGTSMEGSQAVAPAPGGAFAAGAVNPQMTTGAGAPYGFDSSAAGGGTTPGGSLSTMYGPQSTASQSPMGSAISNGADTSGITSGVTANPTSTLGQGVPGKMDDLLSLFQQSQANPWMKLLNTGMNAYQQFAQQGAQDRYRNQIDQEFSPNSPYAQQMQQTLARQDAAAGRNSQGGTRAVQLAAALAQAHATALGNSNYYHAATATPGANALNSLFANFGTNQGFDQLKQLGTSGFNSLQSLFGG